MAVVENVRESLRDIGSGIVSVIRGDPKTSVERRRERAEREFERLRVPTEVGQQERTITGERVPGTTREITAPTPTPRPPRFAGGGMGRNGRQPTPTPTPTPAPTPTPTPTVTEIRNGVTGRVEIRRLTPQQRRDIIQQRREEAFRRIKASKTVSRQQQQRAERELRKIETARELRERRAPVTVVGPTREVFEAELARREARLEPEVQPAAGPEGILERVGLFFTRQRDKAFTERIRGEPTTTTQILGGPAAGLAAPVLGTAALAIGLVTEPVKTVKAIPAGVVESVRKLPELGTVIRQEPGFVGGALVGEVGLAKGFGVIAEKGVQAARRARGFARTVGLEEIPFEQITVEEPFAQAPRGTTGKQLAEQFAEQRIVTAGGVDKVIKLPGEEIGVGGVRVFTASKSGPRGERFTAGLGASREPGPFFSPQLSKEFLEKGVSVEPTKLFGLGGIKDIFKGGEPIAFRTTFRAIEELPEKLLEARRAEIARGEVRGFKGFATPAEQEIIRFRATKQDPTKALISTRFSTIGGEIEAIGRAGAVFERIGKPEFFTRLPTGRRVLIERIKPTGEVLKPADLIRRERGTAIVRSDKGILLTFAEEEGAFILPGGGVDIGETAARATARELLEETGLRAKEITPSVTVKGDIKRFGVKRPGFRFVEEEFKVFEVKATGKVRPTGEVSKVAFYKPGSKIKISPTTRKILELTGDIKKGKKPRKPPKAPKMDIEIKRGTIEEFARISSESIRPAAREIITPGRLFRSSLLLPKARERLLAPAPSESILAPGISERVKAPAPSESILAPGISERVKAPAPKKPIIPRPPISDEAKRKKKKKQLAKKVKGYIAQVKEKGKWKSVNPKRPLSKKEAKDLALLAADRTIAASARIKQTKKPAMKALKNILADDTKFRSFKKQIGKQIPLKNQWIEKRKHRLDTKNEVQTLQAFKRSAEFKGLFPKQKTRRKGTTRRKTNSIKQINWFA